MDKFNPQLCTERHEQIGSERSEMFKRLKEVENRWLVLMTALVANMAGIIAILITK